MLQFDMSLDQRLEILQLLLVDHLLFSSINLESELVDLFLGLNQWAIIRVIIWGVFDQFLMVYD